MLTLMVINIL